MTINKSIFDNELKNSTKQLFEQMLLKTDCLEAQIKVFKNYLNNGADLEDLINQGTLIFNEICGMLDDIETQQAVVELPDYLELPSFPSIKL